MDLSTKSIHIGDRTVSITGSLADPYFLSLEAFAAQLEPLRRFVSERNAGGLILDVGANIGLTSLAMSFAAPNGRVIAFEPSPANIPLFEANTRGHAQIHLERCGVADQSGWLDFVVPEAGANCHVATAEYEYASDPNFHGVRAPITTLDAYWGEMLGGKHVSIIKVDVEGFEPNVLAGARSLMSQCRPAIWLEFNSVTLNVAHGYSPMAFAKALFECFEVLRVQDDGTLRQVPSVGALVHDNITLHGSVEDIVLLARPGVLIPDVETMTLPGVVNAELKRLRAQVAGRS
jgi:FkbM family methyltransferase